MKIYQDMLKHILANGVQKGDRTGTGTISTFGYQMRHDLSLGFPILTTKKIHWKSVVYELLWLISGSTNVKWLQDRGVKIWDSWADKETGELGPVYGHQWRNFMGPYKTKDGKRWSYGFSQCADDKMSILQGRDQLKEVVDRIRTNPDCRRLIVTAWNPLETAFQALPACHSFFQFYVANGKLSCHMYQRSADAFLGIPFNIASYALLTHMVAHVTGLQVGEFVHSFGDLHIYNTHQNQVREQLQRNVLALPDLAFQPPVGQLALVKEIDDFATWPYEWFQLQGYNPHPAIAAPVAV
jgi:thymidylate synthase